MKRYYISKIIGDGTFPDPYRPKIATYGVDWSAVIHSDESGHPLFAEVLAIVATLRTTLDDLCGSQNTLKASIQSAQKRPANRLEKLFASGACTAASPSSVAVEGGLGYADVLAAMGW